MFVAHSTRTMANAKRVVEDRPIELRPFSRRQAVINLVEQWNLAKQAKERELEERRRRETERQEAYIRARDAAREAHERAREITPEPNPRSTPQEIIARVLAWHPGVSKAEVLGSSRAVPVVEARYDCIVAVYLNCSMDGRPYSMPRLGRIFGGRDHSSIYHCLAKRGYREEAQAKSNRAGKSEG